VNTVTLKGDSMGNCEQCSNSVLSELYQKLDDFIDNMQIDITSQRRKGNLIQILHKAQHLFGYLPEEVQLHVARKLRIHHSEVSGVISFYNFFTTVPKGKHRINICMGTACFVKGADKILEEFEKYLNIKSGETTEDKKFSIDLVRCIGACGLAPVVTIDDHVYGRIVREDVKKIMDEFIESIKEKNNE
jgi:NADH:ubiquinone oxidoreductase subunit E